MKKNAKVSLIIPTLVPALAVTFAAISMLLSSSAVAQMRPDCFAEPSKPGACFFTPPAGGLFFRCEDGALLTELVVPEPEREIGRVNPNGTIAVHITDRIVPTRACRFEDFGICGTYENPGPGLFYGEASIQINAFVTEGGSASCPSKATVKGTFFRDMGYGPEEIVVDAVLQSVKDSKEPTGCRLQKCRIFAPIDGMQLAKYTSWCLITPAE